MTKLLEIKNVSKKYNTINGEVVALDNISFDVEEGEFVAIVGTSGCGKSTLLSILATLEEKTTGEIIYSKEDVITGYMLQDDALFEHMTIEQNILLGLKILKKLNDNTYNSACNLLKKYDLYKFKDKKPSQLSGGMKQRVLRILYTHRIITYKWLITLINNGKEVYYVIR